LVSVPVGPVTLEGNLGIPESTRGIVLFAHGSGSGRRSPRNRYVAGELRQAGLATLPTLPIDLLKSEEEEVDLRTRHLWFDIGLLSLKKKAKGPEPPKGPWSDASPASDTITT
jgi:putative phosphoribosyl transferase